MMYPRNLPLLIISILILANVLALVRGQSQTYCSNSNNTAITAYQSNLLYLLGSMPSNMDHGFYNASRGHDTDRVNIMAICRADTQPDICSGCVSNLTDDISASCLIERQAISFSFLCWLHYSDIPMFGIINYDQMFWETWDPRNVTGAPEFMSDLMILLNKLIPRAARGGSLQKVAFGNRTTSDFQTIYALVQCTPDLSEQDCVSCLTTGVQQLSICCEAKGNVRFYVANCDIRYGTAHFYNETRLLELDSPTVTVSRPSAPPLPLGGKKDSATTQTIIIVIVSAFTGTLMIIAFVASLLIRRKRSLNHQASKTHNSEAQSLPSPPPATAGYADLLRLKFDEIRVATNDFSKELGRGAFGAVFWGKLPGGREIAVKRLEIGSNQGEREFKAEVSILAQLKHRNLVTLIGFSSEGEEKLLVYEYVENGCLSKFLFDRTECPNLDWKTRYNIIEGIVKGIVYLHEDSQLKIVHRDLKPSNILLDGNMDSKIADFGLARLIELDETHCSTNKVAGTPGYIAPEYQFLHQISMKSDVFSFGVLLLEIISGQKNSRHGHLTSRAWDAWETRTVENLVDPVLLKDASSMLGTILRCIHIGLLCVQPKASDRPSITSIATMLNSPSMLLPEPSNNGFYTEFHSVESQ